MFYGSLLNLTILGNETSAGDNFELSTLPSGLTFSPEIKAGVCELTDPNGRILHLHASDPGVILPPVTDLSFCTATTVSSGASTSLFASATSRLASWFAPSPANAAATRAFKVGGGGAGLVGGLSKIGPVTYTSTMAWVAKPGNTSRSKNPQFTPVVTVLNGSAGGNNLQGATITLVVSTNKGSFTVTGNTAATDASGHRDLPEPAYRQAGWVHGDGGLGAWRQHLDVLQHRRTLETIPRAPEPPARGRDDRMQLAARKHSRFRAASALHPSTN